MRSFFTLVLVTLALASQAGNLVRFLLRICTAKALLVFRTNGFPIRFCGDLLGGQVLFVCVLHLNGERVEFSDLIGTRTGFATASGFDARYRRIPFLYVWEGGGRCMDGEVGSFSTGEAHIESLFEFNRITSIGDDYLEG